MNKISLAVVGEKAPKLPTAVPDSESITVETMKHKATPPTNYQLVLQRDSFEVRTKLKFHFSSALGQYRWTYACFVYRLDNHIIKFLAFLFIHLSSRVLNSSEAIGKRIKERKHILLAPKKLLFRFASNFV